MKLKSFFANSIEEAIRLARYELGPEAMLVNSKRTDIEARHLGCYEVVICDVQTTSRDSAHSQESSAAGLRTAAVTGLLPVDKLSQDVSELKHRMEKLALTLARSGRGMASVAFDPERSRAFTALTDVELDTDVAYEVVGRLPSSISDHILRAEVAKLVNIDTNLGIPGSPS